MEDPFAPFASARERRAHRPHDGAARLAAAASRDPHVLRAVHTIGTAHAGALAMAHHLVSRRGGGHAHAARELVAYSRSVTRGGHQNGLDADVWSEVPHDLLLKFAEEESREAHDAELARRLSEQHLDSDDEDLQAACAESVALHASRPAAPPPRVPVASAALRFARQHLQPVSTHRSGDLTREVYDAGGGGDCLFYSIAAHVYQDVRPETAQRVRDEVADYMQHNGSLVGAVVEAFATVARTVESYYGVFVAAEHNPTSFADYVRLVRQEHMPGDTLCVMVASLVYRVPFVIEKAVRGQRSPTQKTRALQAVYAPSAEAEAFADQSPRVLLSLGLDHSDVGEYTGAHYVAVFYTEPPPSVEFYEQAYLPLFNEQFSKSNRAIDSSSFESYLD
jgi:hypothetical protein